MVEVSSHTFSRMPKELDVGVGKKFMNGCLLSLNCRVKAIRRGGLA
jgi:hypothetical protein